MTLCSPMKNKWHRTIQSLLESCLVVITWSPGLLYDFISLLYQCEGILVLFFTTLIQFILRFVGIHLYTVQLRSELWLSHWYTEEFIVNCNISTLVSSVQRALFQSSCSLFRLCKTNPCCHAFIGYERLSPPTLPSNPYLSCPFEICMNLP